MSRFVAGALPGEKVQHLNDIPMDVTRGNLLVDGVCVLDLTDRQPINQYNYNQYLSIFI